MKTFCKPSTTRITDPDFIEIAVYDCVKKKLARNDFCHYLMEETGITFEEIIEERKRLPMGDTDTPKIDAAIKILARNCASDIQKRSLHFFPVRQFSRRDGISQKERLLSQETPKQQVFEYIAVYALMPLFEAKILDCQFASIPGRGQVAGMHKIQKILNKEHKGKRIDCIKVDIRKAYPSTSTKLVQSLINKYCGKNKDLQYLVSAIMSTYPDGHLIIGGYFSTWAFNLVMSFVLRDMLEMGNTRRGVFTRSFLQAVCYADDVLLFGYKSTMMKALKKFDKKLKVKYGLELKGCWTIVSFPNTYLNAHLRDTPDFVDMMGYRVYRNRTTVRRKIFKRARRQILRAKSDFKRFRRVPIWRARKIAAYNGYIANTDNCKINLLYHIDELMVPTKDAISHCSKEDLKSYERDLQLYPSYSIDFPRWRKDRHNFEERYRASRKNER